MQPFSRVRVEYVVRGGARIWWEINRHFIDPGPYVFQLQAGHTSLEGADDWTDVGAPVTDTYMTFDTDKRLFGKTLDVHYRLLLTTPNGNYTSMTASAEGLLSKRDWLKYKEITRKELLRHRVLTSVNGYLLKARRYGPICTECTDSLTGEVSNSQCVACYGTGFELGYFAPLAATYADIGLAETREHRNADVGMQKEHRITARFVGDPQVYSYDVWCNAFSDERFYMHTIGQKAHVRGVPLIYDVELRLAPFTDVIYKLPLTQLSPPTLKRSKASKEQPVCQSQITVPVLNYLEAALSEAREKRARSSRH